jgi:dihydroorotate dehydrogenase
MVTLAGLKLQTPLISAAGVQNGTDLNLILKKFKAMTETNLGAITLGSFTIVPNPGNEDKYGPPVYYYDNQEKLTYNSMGLANIGADKAVKLLPKLLQKTKESNKVLIFSGSPLGSSEHGSSVEQALKLTQKFLATDVDLVELNVSCPNIVLDGGARKLMMGYDLQSMTELIDELKKININGRLGIKMPPFLNDEEKAILPELAGLLIESNACSFLTICNTIPNQIPQDENGRNILSVPEGKAGMSGPATNEEGRRQLKMWRELVGDKIDIVSLLGVDSQEEFTTRLKMGAKAAGGVTFLRESNNFKKAVDTMLGK